MTITIPERGSVPVNSEAWAKLSADPQFWKLVEGGIVQVEASRSGGARLKGTCYVGRALIGSTTVQVVEKFSGAFEALVNMGLLKPPKIILTPSAITDSSNSLTILVSLFLQAVRRYLTGNRKLAYVQVQDAGIVIGGRLDIVGTIHLRARGFAHQASFTRTVLTGDIPFNHCIYAALRSIERIARTIPIPQSDVTSARALRLAFSECLPAVLRARPGELARIAAMEASKKHNSPQVSDVISLAGALLDVAGFGGELAWSHSVPRSWFINLETFFEEAVRKAVDLCLKPEFEVAPARNRPPLFPNELVRYRANPDIVISTPRSVVAIADAKYVEFSGWPEQPDMFELLAHAAAYHATRGLLFYPSESGYSARTFGNSATNCTVWAFGLTFDHFLDDVRTSLQRCGLLGSTPNLGNV